MAPEILDNQDRTLVIDLSDVSYTRHFRPALVDIKTYLGNNSISQLDNAIFTGVQSGRGSKYRVDESLTGKRYYTSFGPRLDPIVISGLMVVPTCSAAGSSQGDGSTAYADTSGFNQLESFASTYETSDSDLKGEDLLNVYIDDPNEERAKICAFVNSKYGAKQAKKASARIFTFQLTFEEMN